MTSITWRAWFIGLLLWPAAGLRAQPVATPANPPATPPVARSAAGPVYGLTELVRIVLVHNPTLQMALRTREQAEAGIRSAGALPNPRLEFSDGRLRAGNAGGSSGNVSAWGVAQLIENPWLRSARIEAAESGLRGSEAQLGLMRGEVVAQVRVRAYELLLRIEEARAAADELALLEQTRERVRVRVASGEAARYEVIKAEAEFISARQRQQTAQLAAEQARIRLNQLAAGQLPAGWSLHAGLDDTLSLPPVEQLRAQLQEHNPELQSLRAEHERQQARVREAHASRWPGIELRYSDTREPDNQQSMVGASMQIPLLDQRRGPRAEAQAEALRAQTRLEGRQVELQLQLEAAVMTLEMARLRVESLGTGAVRDAEAALRVAEAAYRYGERGILDMLDAQRVLRTVRADLLQARFQQQAAAIEIDLLTGRNAELP